MCGFMVDFSVHVERVESLLNFYEADVCAGESFRRRADKQADTQTAALAGRASTTQNSVNIHRMPFAWVRGALGGDEWWRLALRA